MREERDAIDLSRDDERLRREPLLGGPMVSEATRVACDEASDSRMLDELARRYAKPLREFFRRRTNASTDIDDLVQETFLRLASRSDLRTIAGVEGYLFQVARNTLRDRARRTAVRVAANEVERSFSDPDDEVPSPESVLLHKEALERVVACLSELPERTRTVFILHRFEHLQYNEIARRLGVSLSTVDKDIMKALTHIARRLA